MTDSLEELREFNEGQVDPEIEKLLKELAENIETLKQPGMDPKETLAKLSEMEASLQQQQEKLSQLDSEAALQDVGKAISLADPLQAAGLAMSQGEMEKAEQELNKLNLPKLDRKTEKAITEKLDALANSEPGAAKNSYAKP